MAAVRMTNAEARAFLTTQLFAPQPDTGAALSYLGAVQMDPVSRVAPSHHLSLALRVPRYRPDALERLRARGGVLEVPAHERCLVPTADLGAHWARLVGHRLREWPARERVRSASEHVLERLRGEGPLPTRAFEGERVEGFWDASGEAATKSTSLALEVLWREGHVAVRRRQGNERTFDLFERVVPAALREEAAALGGEETDARRLDAYMRAVRLARANDPRFAFAYEPAARLRERVERALAEGTLVRVEVAASRRAYLARPQDIEAWGGARSTPRPRLVPPLDNVLWNRARLEDLFGFAYRWEVYVPAERRRVGPYGMPLLVGDAFWGQADVRFDRPSRTLHLRPTPPLPGVHPVRYRRAIERAAEALARTLARFDGEGEVRVSLASDGA